MNVIDKLTNKQRSLIVDADGALYVNAGGADAPTGTEQTAQGVTLTDILAVQPTPETSAGVALPTYFDTLPTTFGYTGTNLTTIVVSDSVGGHTYTQTLAYTGAVLNSISAWVRT